MRILSLAVLFLAAAWLPAQNANPALKSMLDATGLKYSVTKAGSAAVTYLLDDDRSQVVYVSGSKTKIGALEFREVWSNAANLPADLEPELLIALLTEGGQEDLGAWYLEETDDGYLAYFAIRLPEISAANLKSVLEHVASIADAKEAELSEEDEN